MQKKTDTLKVSAIANWGEAINLVKYQQGQLIRATVDIITF